MSSLAQLTATPRQDPRPLESLAAALTILENQWISLRDDPRRVSLEPGSRVDYLKRLDRWYTTAMPRDKAALLSLINDYGEAEGFGGVWAVLVARCEDACEKSEQLEQLEVAGNSHVYFAGGPRVREGFLR